ncbi:MAG: carbamate kinase [Gudongella sp.]|nr:carbamate kinase [Gudongella sp.]
MSRILIALGGNALGDSPEEQQQILSEGVENIADLIEEGHDVVLVHGNGPQVGMINLALDNSNKLTGATPDMPFPECGAMSQGYIGYHIQNALKRELTSRKIVKNVVTVITQVVVDSEDTAFQNPTKPIGKFYSKEEAKKIEVEKGYAFKEDSGRGYRRVVASPKPVDIVEIEVIDNLVNSGTIVIAAGGGGIPVVVDGYGYKGVPAVIDKDLASEKLAELLKVDILLILTAVDRVAINFGKADQKDLDKVSIEEAEKYSKQGQFGAGSMEPKINAAVGFVKTNKGVKAIIGSLENAKGAIDGTSGTTIQ